MRSLAELVETDHLARVFAVLLLSEDDELTPDEVRERTGVARATVYDDLRRLDEAGLAERATDGRPHRYRAVPDGLTLSPWQPLEPRERLYFLGLVVALARREENSNLETFLERHGIEALADALAYTFERLEGRTTMRSMARALDLPVVEAETVFQELVAILGELDRSTDGPDLPAELDAESLPQSGG
jgi:DNA-binding transcriptional ArsR family regulator